MNWNFSSKFHFVVLFGLLAFACNPDDEVPCTDNSCGFLTDIPCDPQAYNYSIPQGLPLLPTAVSQNTTVEGIALGRRLFYDPILSADSTMSCAGCHFTINSFTDAKAVSVGIDGIPGKRSSMSLLNVGYYDNGLFWDGRVNSLPEQALLPVEDPV
ncbi:MAG: cytochrome C peroxidase, partial [Saprospiraceae bacterium]|nr:cytochrome C peroxidase [Saprospiraceae bacterium]